MNDDQELPKGRLYDPACPKCAELRAELAEAKRSKDGAYSERDKCVATIATLAHALGWTVYLGTHVGEWEDDWRNIVFIDTPAGQVSWHYHDSEREWFSWIGLVQPREPKAWDGHSTPEKYERLHGLCHDGVRNEAAFQYRRILGHALHMTSEAKDWNATVGCESDAPGDSTCIDMGIDACGPCKIGQAAEELENLLRGRTSDSWQARAESAEAALAALRVAAVEVLDVLTPWRDLGFSEPHVRAEAFRRIERMRSLLLGPAPVEPSGIAGGLEAPMPFEADTMSHESPAAKCSTCGGKGYTRHLGPHNDEVVIDCPDCTVKP